jgi:hypothetical protein
MFYFADILPMRLAVFTAPTDAIGYRSLFFKDCRHLRISNRQIVKNSSEIKIIIHYQPVGLAIRGGHILTPPSTG